MDKLPSSPGSVSAAVPVSETFLQIELYVDDADGTNNSTSLTYGMGTPGTVTGTVTLGGARGLARP